MYKEGGYMNAVLVVVWYLEIGQSINYSAAKYLHI